jgi:hypothetical protein
MDVLYWTDVGIQLFQIRPRLAPSTPFVLKFIHVYMIYMKFLHRLPQSIWRQGHRVLARLHKPAKFEEIGTTIRRRPPPAAPLELSMKQLSAPARLAAEG